jgi:hypothetical protein
VVVEVQVALPPVAQEIHHLHHHHRAILVATAPEVFFQAVVEAPEQQESMPLLV